MAIAKSKYSGEPVVPIRLSDATREAFGSLKTATWVFDLEKKCIPWGNRAACALWGAQSLEDLISRDFTDISDSALSRLYSAIERILDHGEEHTEQWTFYPHGREKQNGDDPFTVTCVCTHSVVLLEDGRKAVLLEAHVKDRAEVNHEHVRIIESMRHAPLCMSAYTIESRLLYQNPRSLQTYGTLLSEQSTMFSQLADQTSVAFAIRVLKQNKLYQAEQQVNLPNGQKAWHEIIAREINDPVTGKPIYLVIEANIDARKLAETRLAGAHAEITQNLDLIRTMLESIDQAFLIFNRQGICTNTPAHKSKQILGLDPTGRHLCEILESESNNRESMDCWLTMLFDQRLPFEDLVAHGPQRSEIANRGATLKLKFHPMLNPDGSMHALIFTATDISREIAKTWAAEAERKRAEMTVRIAEFKPNFRSFLRDFEALASQLESWQTGDLLKLRQKLHTLKGAALLFSADTLSTEVYAAELRIRAADSDATSATIMQEGHRLNSVLKSWRALNFGLLKQLGVFGDESVEVRMTTLAKLEEKYGLSSESKALVANIFDDLISKDIGELLKPFEKHIFDMARRLGKRVTLKVVPKSTSVPVEARVYIPLISSFVHLFNNAVDHGIELPAVRAAAGKSEAGEVEVTYERISRNDADWIRLEVRDDGQGVNVSKLREKFDRVRFPKVEQMNDSEVASLIFSASISTSEVVTELSGQGVGMTSTYAAIAAFGGEMRIVETGPAGTTFEIVLPYKKRIAVLG